MNIQIKHLITDAMLFECELPVEIAARSTSRQLGWAVKQACAADANLADADLTDANLAGAYLARADLTGANLAGAYLADARSIPAGIEHVDPTEPYERKPTPERYRDRARAQRFRERNPDVPVIEDIDAKILGAIEAGGSLDMSQWHTCETTHCIAGWAITLAGEQGKALESAHGAEIAGRYLFLAATGRAPHFYATNERALEDLRARAQAAIDPVRT